MVAIEGGLCIAHGFLVGMMTIVALGMLLFTPGAKAGNNVWEMKTTVRFSQPLALAGHQVLPAGKYVFRETVPETLEQAPIKAAEPSGEEGAVAEAFPLPAPQAASLPHTASSTPLIALLGLFSIGAAFGLRQLAKTRA